MTFDIPVILLKNLVILPNQEIKIELNNLISGQAIKEASSKYKGEILVVAPIDELEEEPSAADLPKVGVIAKIRNRMEVNDTIQVKLRGIKRVAVEKYFQVNDTDILYSEVMPIDLPALISEEENAIITKLINVLKEYIKSSPNISNSILNYVINTKDLNKITDAIASFLPFAIAKKLEYMQEINPLNRAKSLIRDMNEEIKSIEIDNELEEKIDTRFNEEQRKYLLREKLQVIKEELGEESWKETEINYYRNILKKLKIPKSTKEHITREINKYELMNENSPEVSGMHNYLDWVLNLPWNKASKEELNFNNVYKHLDKTHYGLKQVKDRITEYVAIKNLNKDITSPIICLVGPPGVGKTSIAMSIADALNRSFYKISVGGLNDATELVGSRRTYVSSNPGKIIQGIRKCNTNNPLILIDEIDKMVRDYKGDPASTLLEILDPIQNNNYCDNYIEVPFDLSNVFFILTANDEYDIPSALRDRLEIINLSSYTLFEKKDIAKKYILPRIFKENMVDKKIKFSDELLYFIINNYTSEAGVRTLERTLSSLTRKITINNVKIINEERIIKLLGNSKYTNELYIQDKCGVVNLLAFTPNGGKVTQLELIMFKNKGDLVITGNVKSIMQESVKVACNMLNDKYNYNNKDMDIHIHFLEASAPKDGSSAGLGIATALVSRYKNKVIASDIAFTGEISLTGSILKIGGLKEKLVGAYNNNIKVVYMPKSNESDLLEIPKVVLDNIEIRLVSNFSEVYNGLFKD